MNDGLMSADSLYGLFHIRFPAFMRDKNDRDARPAFRTALNYCLDRNTLMGQIFADRGHNAWAIKGGDPQIVSTLVLIH